MTFRPLCDAVLIFLFYLPRERRLISQSACHHRQGIAGGVPILGLVLSLPKFSPEAPLRRVGGYETTFQQLRVGGRLRQQPFSERNQLGQVSCCFRADNPKRI